MLVSLFQSYLERGYDDHLETLLLLNHGCNFNVLDFLKQIYAKNCVALERNASHMGLPPFSVHD